MFAVFIVTAALAADTQPPTIPGSLTVTGIANPSLGLEKSVTETTFSAAGAILHYARETQRGSLTHFDGIRYFEQAIEADPKNAATPR